MGNSNSGPHSGRGASVRWTRGGLHQLHLPHFRLRHLPSPRSRHDGLQLLLLQIQGPQGVPCAAGQRQRAAAEQTQGQQQHLGFGTQLGMNAANGFAGGRASTTSPTTPLDRYHRIIIATASLLRIMTGMLPASPKQLLIIMPKQGGAGSTFDAFDF
ncbi:hypothetical protein OsJ_20437 [Oryza sativa Japonica Group]|uniref:Uncharacterized protein n=1 Tax=Oryza sativa subsp. japonica TaxID=39947 RepID=Q69YB2_ORYSJ|nr:hypothetical protein OsJ_20437 [Oryza sativa Japonica Group]BAD35215.1 hypothetical protein [Oryza sativa Japonica Group]BAD35651.1 hypothetical protein [Oryza sativa Japonica Group]